MYRTGVLLSFFIFASLLAIIYSVPDGYNMVWNDEFDNYDRSKWSPQTQKGADTGNNELQYYIDSPDTASVSNGNMNLRAIQRQQEGYNIVSGKLVSTRKFTFGYIEIRAKIPKGPGTWPAIWMLPVPTHNKYGGWAACGEMDIMETVNDDPNVYGTLHMGGEWPKNVQYPPSGQNSLGSYNYNDYHSYGLEWTPTYITFYVDGAAKNTITSDKWFAFDSNGNRFPSPAPFDGEFNCILNVAVGGAWPCGTGGCPPADRSFPATMSVDYVRYYERNGGNNNQPPPPPPPQPPQPPQPQGNCPSPLRSCGGACYHCESYGCNNGQLTEGNSCGVSVGAAQPQPPPPPPPPQPQGNCPAPLRSCGDACYHCEDYGCNNGQLTQGRSC